MADPQSIIVAFGNPSKVFDAIDCPQCGCQHILKERLTKVKGGVEDDD